MAVVILWHSTKFCVKDLKEKSVKFSEIKSKEKSKFLRNHLGKGEFSVEKLGLFFQSYYLVIQLLAEAVAMKWWKLKKKRLSPETERTNCLTNGQTI